MTSSGIKPTAFQLVPYAPSLHHYTTLRYKMLDTEQLSTQKKGLEYQQKPEYYTSGLFNV
jgi:hypothetical protein